MLTIIHGDDISKSRKYFIDLKEKYPDAVIFDGQDIKLTDLAQILEGGELFSDTHVLFIEQLITKKKSSLEYKSIINYLLTHAKTATVVIWEGKEIEKNTLSLFKDSILHLFKLPQSLFIFLDSIKPGNGKQLLQLFHQTLSTVDEEGIFYMLIRHVRLLMSLHPQAKKTEAKYGRIPAEDISNNQNSDDKNILSSKSATIEELKRLQSWQSAKLLKQSSQFSLKQLLTIYSNLYAIESAYKTGGLSGSLSSSIDIFLLGV
jgi:hypothetical protein